MHSKCRCEMILFNSVGEKQIVIHLLGCPEHEYTKEYQQMSWWEKIWSRSPESLYNDHFRI